MLGDITAVENIYIACGYTDMRKSIDGLAAIVQTQFHLDPFSKSLFLFCGKRRDRIKALLWEGDGFILLYKRLENGSFRWPRKESDVKAISWQQFRWLMEGLEKALAPTSLMNHSLASPSSVANVMYQKYVNSVPLYRQEQSWEQIGISLSRATMANWIIRCTEDYLLPVVECLRKQLLAREVIHCDETPVQVLKEAGKKPQTKSYMWLYCTGEEAQAPIIVYDYQPSRNGDHAENAIRPFAVGRKNWLFADSPKGASASAAVYSIVETAKANNLHPYSYLEYLLLYMPDTDWRNHPEELDALMPWADAVQAQCHIPQSD